MPFSLPPLSLTGGAGGAAGPVDANSQVGTPVNVSQPWNQTKNYQNHSSGSQSASSTANPTSSASGSLSDGLGAGFDMKYVLIAAAAWYLLA